MLENRVIRSLLLAMLILSLVVVVCLAAVAHSSVIDTDLMRGWEQWQATMEQP